MGETYFMTWNALTVNSDSDNTGEGALYVDKAFENKKSEDRIENSQN
jgi:hypothetical protein